MCEQYFTIIFSGLHSESIPTCDLLSMDDSYIIASREKRLSGVNIAILFACTCSEGVKLLEIPAPEQWSQRMSQWELLLVRAVAIL